MAIGGREDTDDDLWEKVTKTVTAANRDDVLITPKKTSDKAKIAKKPKLAKPASPQMVAGQKPSKAKAVIQPADLRLAERAGIDKSSARRLTRGSFEIDDRLDLHGMTEAIAHRALLKFVSSAHFSSYRTLLIITGKGTAGQGVLRRKVPHWLKEPPLADKVLAITEASPKDGGSGALYVRMRRKRDVT